MAQAPARLAVIAPFAGLAPLFAGLVAVLAPGFFPLDPLIAERALIGYGALLLAFLGGVRWGALVMTNRRDEKLFLYASAGSLLGLVALVLPFAPALALLVVGFAAQGAWDVWSGWRKALPDAYVRSRALVTVLICFTLILALLLA